MRSSQVVAALRRRWPWSVAGIGLGLVLGSLVALNTPAKYTGTAQVLVTAVAAGSSTSDLAQGGTFAQQQVVTYARLADTRVVLEPVAQQLGLTESVGDLAGQVSADAPVNTSLISVTAADRNPVRAADIANAVAQSLTDVIPRLAQAGDGAVTPVRGTVIEAAQPAGAPASPNVRLYLVVGVLLGLAGGAGAALLRDRTDTRVVGEEGLAGVSRAPVLGVLPVPLRTRDAVAEQAQAVEAREALRHLRASVIAALRTRGGSSLVLTEPLPTGPRHALALDLATVCADSGQQVLYVDADLRHGGHEGYAGGDPATYDPFELGAYSSGAVELSGVTADGDRSGLTVVPAGRLSTSTGELLSLDRLEAFVDAARDRYDLVIVQAPPVLPFSDAAVLAQVTDGVVMVVPAGRVREDDVHAACARLDAVGAAPLGFVLDGVHLTAAQRRRRSALARSLEQR